MKKQLFALLAVSFTLAGCFNNGADTEEEVDGEADDATSEEEEADELLNEEEEEHSRESENDVDSVAPEPVVHTETFEREGEEVEVGVTVHPIEREDDLAIFTVEFEKVSGEARIGLDHMLSHPSTTRTSNQSTARGNQYDRLGYQIRLFDSTNDTISHTLFYQEYRDDRGDQYLSTHALKSEEIDNREFNEGDIVSYSAVFDAPTEEQVHVMMESFDLILDVPVVQSDEVIDTAEGFLYENVLDTTSTSLEDLTEQIYPLQTYNESVNAPVGTLVEEGQASITLDSDVLFEFDSAELQDDTEQILETTAEELERVSGGNLMIVGHTDDQGDEAYNQELSESRAQSVYEELETIMDLEVFDGVETEGMSFNEPLLLMKMKKVNN
ncbi:OmpA family protein [Geomicrobium sp. JCM 19039]|uniref:OmpA family protein n=1 Tax=Geomicrobium sp. JCM 19039 TaxID=1460636 RepID=UPI00045F2421|nr:OmpA family protein [Geomicrobium sp. JCM 19039]GAK10729.1 outer membrane protein [Geomicrobium sp. JCM 19039]